MFKPLSKEVTLKWEGVTGLTLYSTREIKKDKKSEEVESGWVHKVRRK